MKGKVVSFVSFLFYFLRRGEAGGGYILTALSICDTLKYFTKKTLLRNMYW